MSMMGGLLPPVVAHVGADVREFSAKMGEVKGEMATVEATGGSSFQKLAAVGKTALLAISAAAVGVGIESIHLADQFEESHARLVTAVNNSGSSMQAWQSTIKAADDQLEHLGHSNIETENALSRLVPATHSQTQANRDLGIAADLAAQRHMSLEQATDLLVKVEGGRYTGLTRTLGVSKDVIASFRNQDDAIMYLAGHTKGAAANASETFAGKLKVLEAQATDLGIKVGQFLIPIVEDVVGVFTDAATWLEQNRTVAYALAGVIGGVLVTAITTFVATKIIDTAHSIADAFHGIVNLTGNVVEFFSGSAARAAADAAAQDIDAAAATANGAAHEVAAGQLAMFGGEAGGAGLAAEGAGGGVAGLGAVVAPVVVTIGAMAGATLLMNELFGQGAVAGATISRSMGSLNDPVDKLTKRYKELIQDNKDLSSANTDVTGTIGGVASGGQKLTDANTQLAKWIRESTSLSVDQAAKLGQVAVAAGATDAQIRTLNAALSDAKVHHDDAAAAAERQAAFLGGLAGTTTTTAGVVRDATGAVLGYATSVGFIPASKATTITNTADTARWFAGLYKGTLDELDAMHINTGVDVDIGPAMRKLREVANITKASGAPDLIGPLLSMYGYAKGGVASGLSIVGEQGAELVDFANPGRVYPAEDTAAILGNSVAGVGGGTTIVNNNYKVEIVAPIGATPESIMRTIADGLRDLARGGNTMPWHDDRVGRPGM